MVALLPELIGSLVRAGVLFSAGWFVQQGIWTQDQAARFSTAITAWLVAALMALGWSLWQKYRARLKFLTALESPAGTHEAVVEDRIKRGVGASVLTGSLVALCFLSVSCASVGGSLVAADRAVHTAVTQTQDTGERLCDRQVLSAETCQKFFAQLVPVLSDADAFNRAVASQSVAQVPAMIAALERLAASVLGLLPDDAQRDALHERITVALDRLRAVGGTP